MNPTIEILLKRMESNPEEFKFSYNNGRSKWDVIYEDFEPFLDEADRNAYQEGKRQLNLNQFHSKVMEELLDPKSEESHWGDSSLTRLGVAMPQAGQTHAQHTALHQQALQMQSMQAQMAYEAHKAQQAIKAQQYNPYLQNTGSGLSGLLGGSK